MQEMFVPLLDKLDAQGYNWPDLDSIGWGTFDMLVVIHSGYPAELGPPNAECNINQPEQRIWSQGIAGSIGWMSSDYAYSLSNYLLVGAFFEPKCGDIPLELGVVRDRLLCAALHANAQNRGRLKSGPEVSTDIFLLVFCFQTAHEYMHGEWLVNILSVPCVRRKQIKLTSCCFTLAQVFG